MTELVALRHATFHSLMAEVDHVVAVCQWVKDLLLRNGVPEEKITISRQGLCHSVDSAVPRPAVIGAAPSQLRIVFFGRLDPTKGAHILIEALKSAPGIPAELDIYGVAQGATGAAYLRRLKQLAEGDHRITFREPIPANEVVSRMRDYDVLAVPSQLLETGPMVVLEAFATGIPVIGSNLGGIAELVTHGVDGLLVEAGNTEAWAAVLRQLAGDPDLRARLRNRVSFPKKMSRVAGEMLSLYKPLIPDLAGKAQRSTILEKARRVCAPRFT